MHLEAASGNPDDRRPDLPRPSALELLQQVLTGRDETERELLIEFARGLVRGLDHSAPAVGAAVMTAQAAYAAVAVSLRAAGPAMPSPVSRPRVLVVDDSPDVLVALGAFVEGAGYDAVKAANAEEALRVLAADGAVRVLVTDLAMPGASGADLIVQARALRPGLPALIVTGFPGAVALDGLPAQVDVLPKPFRRHDFIDRLRALLVRAGGQAPAVSSVSMTI